MNVVTSSGRRRSIGGANKSGGGGVAGSVWESRMKSDEIKGGIKVFTGGAGGEDNNNGNGGNCEENGKRNLAMVKRGKSGRSVAVSGKRKTWKAESFTIEGTDKNPIQIAKEVVNGGGGNGGAAKKSPVQAVKKGRSEENERSPVQTRKSSTTTRSDHHHQIVKFASPVVVDSSNNKDKDVVVVVVEPQKEQQQPVQLRKSKSESINKADQKTSSLVQLRKAKSESHKDLDVSSNSLDASVQQNERFPDENDKIGSEETNCKELDVVCQEKVISTDATTNVGPVVQPEPEPELPVPAIDIEDHKIDGGDDNDEDVEEVGEDQELEEEEEEEEEEFEEVEVEVEIEKKSGVDIKEINVQEEHKPKRVLVFNEPTKKFNQFNNKTTSFTSTVKKQPPPVIKRATIYSDFTKPTRSNTVPDDHYQSFPDTHNNNKLQNLVDLVMWRDVSKSAFVFGIGTFVIVSSSYTQDLSFSFISVISYLGLVYLAAIFLYRAIICRGVIDIDGSRYVVGEEEAVWLLKLILPYMNEFLLKLRALFSGDPATTMKLAVLLFVLARCGSSITVWKMTKLGFFGVFIVPKVCSSYSTQLTAYGKFWIRRFRDAWDSCSHKKAVAVAIFTLVWNLSSVVARVWAAFMLFVALRYYQQKMVTEDWVEDHTVQSENTWHEPICRREGKDKQWGK